MRIAYCLFFYLLATSCHRPPPLSGHALQIYEDSELCAYRRHFDRKALRPLKKQWPELYYELRRGGIQLCQSVSAQDTLIESYQLLYSDLVSGSMQQPERMDAVPFLSSMDNFLLVYGPPTFRQYLEVPDQRIVHLIHRPYETRSIYIGPFDGHTQHFDAATGRRLVRADFMNILERIKARY